MIVVGCGALNLDLIFEVEDIGLVASRGFSLAPGRECVLGHREADRLVALLQSEGTLLGRSGGGSSANTLCALAKMGHRAYFIGTVGEDEYGRFLMESMDGVDCSLITRSGRSSMCIIVMDRLSNDRAMAVVPGTLEIAPPALKMETVLKNASLLHISSLVQERGPEIQEGLSRMCGPECLVSFDPGEIYADRGLSAIRGLLRRTALLFASDVEFDAIFQGRSVMEVINSGLVGTEAETGFASRYEFFRQMPPPVVARKSGAEGAMLVSAGSVLQCPAQKVEQIVDNTGAGDAFDAGLINAIFSGRDPRQALGEAVTTAAFSLGFTGRSWIEHMDELRRRLP